MRDEITEQGSGDARHEHQGPGREPVGQAVERRPREHEAEHSGAERFQDHPWSFQAAGPCTRVVARHTRDLRNATLPCGPVVRSLWRAR
ncbi:hypothetical protein GCM10010350_62850 [Streptomyces galilaeus]|nr:hypothetical protein GCM10010350_62850 [Streptomyces galilaeus]